MTDAGAPGANPAAPLALLPRTKVKVVCGDISFAVYPVFVGHFAGDAISGEESRFDLALNGQLTLRHTLGMYPQQVGSTYVARDSRQSVAGVVVGLGDVGSFTAGTVRTALFAGLTELALSCPGGSVTICPPGLGKTPLSLDTLITAGVNAITEVQLRLIKQGLQPFSEIEIVNPMEDDAHLTWHAMSRFFETFELKAIVDFQPEVSYAPGWARRVGRQDDQDEWLPIQITDVALPDGTHSLQFTAVGGLARAEGFVTPDTRATVAALIAAAIHNPPGGSAATASTPARALFELTWPAALKQTSIGDSNVRLIVDDVAAALPFELMDDRRADADPSLAPPSVRHGVVRQLVQQRFEDVHGGGLIIPTALVIGDPRGGPDAPDFAPLPGARDEARAVAALLTAAGFAVTLRVGEETSPNQVVEDVLSGGWTLIHIAAHGEYEYAFRTDRLAGVTPLPRYTGVILANKIVLSPADLQGMPDPPSLAFINCCRLGVINDADETALQAAGKPDFAAGFAAEMIAMGAHAVIAAGWCIGDAPALDFAKAFYAQMLDPTGGPGFGEAVRLARGAAWRTAPDDPTWGAYQAYGEPDWRLSPPQASDAGAIGPAGDDEAEISYASPNEAMADLVTLVSQIQVGAGRGARLIAARQRLAQIETFIKARDWLTRRGVPEALARAFEALGDDAAGCAYYELAIASDARPTVHALEQRARLRAIAAAAAARDAGDPTNALAAIAAARDELRSICALAGPTTMRACLIGEACQRMGQLSVGDARVQALREMADAYGQAMTGSGRLPGYAALMRAAALIALGAEPGDADVTAALAQIETALGPLDPGDTHFEPVATRAAALLLTALVANADMVAAAADADARYDAGWNRAGDVEALERSVDFLDFLSDMLGPDRRGVWLDGLKAHLAGLASG
ncbi:MAG TPA: CHAT domain-containing protein [Caulobacteraceae bacterium]|jgi:hypothetical protein|nr:CHAT domain-containing protein [Caulobacteraceae bacterium]